MKVSTCPFCQKNEFVLENELAGAFFDWHPVTQGHLLIIPKDHVVDFFETNSKQRQAMADLMDDAKLYLDDRFHPAGYNVGMNIGKAAGQTVFHCHVHVMPRYIGDTPDPTGGIRNQLPPAQF